MGLKHIWLRASTLSCVTHLAKIHPMAQLPRNYWPVIQLHRVLHPFSYKLSLQNWDIPTSDIAILTRLLWANLGKPTVPSLKVKRLNLFA